MEAVDVKTCLEIEGKTVCLPKDSLYRFVTIQPVLRNHERLRHYIQTILTAPGIKVAD